MKRALSAGPAGRARVRVHARRAGAACLLLLAGLAGGLWSPRAALAYPPEVHQQLSFLAARVFNRCVEGTQIPKLSTLNVRYAARSSSEEASPGLITRTFRWQYYDRAQAPERSRWLWMIDTRMQGRYVDLERLVVHGEGLHGEAEVEQRYTHLGELVSHLQDVTVPAVVVPIYWERFWRMSMHDRFHDYPFTLEERDPSLDELCPQLLATPEGWTYSSLLAATAEQTLHAVRAPMPEMDATWQVFWREPDEANRFGEYGNVGNRFGEAVEFRCGRGAQRTTCRLLANDPVYRDFAEARHRDALLATMRAYLLLQRSSGGRRANK